MPYDGIRIAFRRLNLDFVSVCKSYHAFIRGLTTTARIKTGPIECDQIFINSNNRCLVFKAVIVLMI